MTFAARDRLQLAGDATRLLEILAMLQRNYTERSELLEEMFRELAAMLARHPPADA